MVVLRNGDAAVLAEAGGRQVYKDRYTSYSDYNRVTDSRRQPGSVMKPIVYLAAFRHGAALDNTVADEPISVSTGPQHAAEVDPELRRRSSRASSPCARRWRSRATPPPSGWRRASASREVLRTARELGIRTPLQPYITTALGASEVQLLELANAYRALASDVSAEPHVIARVQRRRRRRALRAGRRRPARWPSTPRRWPPSRRGCAAWCGCPSGTAHSLASDDFGIPVMGKTGTSSDFRDALFVGSTYGADGVTVAVRIGYDDNRALGAKETGGRAALPIFRDVVRGIYTQGLTGATPQFPEEMEQRITDYVPFAAAEPAEGWDTAPVAAAPPATLLPVRLFSAVAPVAHWRRPSPMFDPGRSERRSKGRLGRLGDNRAVPLSPSSAARLATQLDCLPSLLEGHPPEALRAPHALGQMVRPREPRAHGAAPRRRPRSRAAGSWPRSSPTLPRYAAEEDPEWPAWAALSTHEVLTPAARATDGADRARLRACPTRPWPAPPSIPRWARWPSRSGSSSSCCTRPIISIS